MRRSSRQGFAHLPLLIMVTILLLAIAPCILRTQSSTPLSQTGDARDDWTTRPVIDNANPHK